MAADVAIREAGTNRRIWPVERHLTFAYDEEQRAPHWKTVH